MTWLGVLLGLPTMPSAPRVEIHTNLGSFEVELYTAHAPKSCQNFMELTKRSYYDNTKVCLFLVVHIYWLCAAVSCACVPTRHPRSSQSQHAFVEHITCRGIAAR